MNPKDDPEFEILTLCWTCGETVEIIYDAHYPDRQYFKCPYCNELLDRFADLQSEKNEAVDRYNEMEKKYNKIAETISNIRFALH